MSDLYQKLNNITLLDNGRANAVLKRVYDITKIKLNLDDLKITLAVMNGDSTRTLERFLGKYDGVIINNVLDYSIYDEYIFYIDFYILWRSFSIHFECSL